MPNQLPSVTQILSPWADFSRVPDQVLERACERGREVHAACASYAQGLFPVLTEEARPYFESFKAWYDAYVAKAVAVEIELKHSVHQYVGHPDLILVLQGDRSPSICDLKTPLAQSKAWRVQLAAYYELARANGIHVERVFSLRLKKDGSFPILDEYDPEPRDLNIFFSAMNTYRYFRGGRYYGN